MTGHWSVRAYYDTFTCGTGGTETKVTGRLFREHRGTMMLCDLEPDEWLQRCEQPPLAMSYR